MLGLETVGSYMQNKQAHKFEDWSDVLLDSEGKLVQEEMTRKFQVSTGPPWRRTVLTTDLDASIAWDQDHVGSIHRQAEKVGAGVLCRLYDVA